MWCVCAVTCRIVGVIVREGVPCSVQSLIVNGREREKKANHT